MMPVKTTKHFHERLMSRFGMAIDEDTDANLCQQVCELIKEEPITDDELSYGIYFDVKIASQKMIIIAYPKSRRIVTCFPDGRLKKHKRKKMFFYDDREPKFRTGNNYTDGYRKKLTNSKYKHTINQNEEE